MITACLSPPARDLPLPALPLHPQEEEASTEQQALERTILEILRKRKPGATC